MCVGDLSPQSLLQLSLKACLTLSTLAQLTSQMLHHLLCRSCSLHGSCLVVKKSNLRFKANDFCLDLCKDVFIPFGLPPQCRFDLSRTATRVDAHTHARTHARTHTHMHARTHARTYTTFTGTDKQMGGLTD